MIGTTIVLIILSSCASAETPIPTEPAIPPTEAALSIPTEPFELTSTAFEPGAEIPARHSCNGENLSPPLAWSTPPSGTQSLVLMMNDPDAIQVVGSTWDHWLLFNIPASTLSLLESVTQTPELADGSRHGRNSSNELGYSGPCPPSGQTHRYIFTLYAVDLQLQLPSGATKEQLLQAINGRVLALAELSGTYTSP
jgi:Raf kinase inhibitor-like YbhB/YbcL family protein